MDSPQILILIAITFISSAILAYLQKSIKNSWNIGIACSAVVFFILLFSVATGSTRDYLGITFSILVSIIGFVVFKYSKNYLDGEHKQKEFILYLHQTLLSVLVICLTTNLQILIAAWISTSYALHNLLIFYGDRKLALIAAHKKYICSRVAELCLALAALLVYLNTNSFELIELNNYLANKDYLNNSLKIAAFLFAIAAVIKSAQLPFHGWLTEIMEAPTTVSALLHAGVINIAGFVIIRLESLFNLAHAAQLTLVIFGGITALLSGLSMINKSSIKANLAWSTSAQMGLMLIECGLGLYDLALLHLVSHSVYKAYSFLNAGNKVYETRITELLNNSFTPVTFKNLILAPIYSGLIILLVKIIWNQFELNIISLLLLTLGTSTLFWNQSKNLKTLLFSIFTVFIICNLFIVMHLIFGSITAPSNQYNVVALTFIAYLILIYYILQFTIKLNPQSNFSRKIYSWAYSGFYIDQIYSSFLLNLWPINAASNSLENPLTNIKTLAGENL